MNATLRELRQHELDGAATLLGTGAVGAASRPVLCAHGLAEADRDPNGDTDTDAEQAAQPLRAAALLRETEFSAIGSDGTPGPPMGCSLDLHYRGAVEDVLPMLDASLMKARSCGWSVVRPIGEAGVWSPRAWLEQLEDLG